LGYRTGPRIITNNLSLFLDSMDKNSYPGTGSSWYDISGNNRNGTLVNNPIFNSEFAKGSFEFNGTNRIDLVSSNQITGDSLQNISICIWINFTTSASAYVVAIQRGSTASSLISLTINRNTLGQNSAGQVGFLTRNFNNSSHVELNHDGGYNDGKWHYLVAIVDGLNRKLYVDGIKKSEDSEGMQSVTSNTSIATIASFGSTNYYTGYLSSVKIYRQSLSEDDIIKNYTAFKGRYM
jgi:hypothetical protein